VEEAQAPEKLLEVGQEVECVILDVDAVNKRISLGLKQLEPDPWTLFIQKYNPGDIIRGKVRSVTDYGVFVGIEDGVDGMVHKSDLSWTQRINNPADVYRKGDEVEAIILSVNHDDKKVSLGIKQLYEDPWTRIPSTTRRARCSRCVSSRSPTSACSWSSSAASRVSFR
jgi:small subunit ribosomal protein S1